MTAPHRPGWCGITRRGFLTGAAAGLAAGGVAGWFASRFLHDGNGEPRRFRGKSAEVCSPEFAMPGPFPGRVVQVHHPSVVKSNHEPDEKIVKQMLDRGMVGLVDGSPSDPLAAWQRFFARGDIIGIKVNPVGRKPKPDEPGRVPDAVGCISSPAVLVAIVDNLKAIGIPPRDIVIFERYADEFRTAGYYDLMRTRPLDGCRWMASAQQYSDTQVDIGGFDNGRDACPIELAPHVVGYDPDVYAHMGFSTPAHDPRDDRRWRSHTSLIVTKMVDKIITIPCLKDHRSAGVTLALKNLSHGMNNNVARSHVSGVAHGIFNGKSVTGPNQCNTFIPQAAGSLPTRQKATLHILDGLIGVYEGGPGCWNKTWSTWNANLMLFSTDPVAMDHVGWDLIDRERARHGWAPVDRMGLIHQTPASNTASELTHLAAASGLDVAATAAAVKMMREGRISEAFDLRTPQHVSLAGDLGLGVFPSEAIDLRRVEMA